MAFIISGNAFDSPRNEANNQTEVFLLKPPEEHYLTVKRASSPLKSTSSTASCCRICHDCEHPEMLISPCECAGTVALVHTTCIEKWLTSSNTNHCDLCKHKFNTQRVAPPFSQWMVSQLHPSASYGFFSDFLCLLVLTPACVISIYLCLREAASNSKATELSIWQYRGFTCLSIILLLSYLFWLYITLRFHLKAFRRWKSANEKVRIKFNRTSQQCRGIIVSTHPSLET